VLTLALLGSVFGGPVWAVLGLWRFPWKRRPPHWRWMLLLLVPPVFSLLWGMLFWVTPGIRITVPLWIVAAPWASFAIALLLTGVLPLTIGRTYRFAAFALGLASLSATILTSFSALMAVTGEYI